MKVLTLLPFLSAMEAIATTAPSSRGGECLCHQDAKDILNKYIAFITHSPNVLTANATGQALFAEKYVFISDSVGSLDGTSVSAYHVHLLVCITDCPTAWYCRIYGQAKIHFRWSGRSAICGDSQYNTWTLRRRLQ